jgi:Na+-driven multidrug efflux pump
MSLRLCSFLSTICGLPAAHGSLLTLMRCSLLIDSWCPRRVRSLGIPFTLLSTALGGIFRGRLDTRTPLAVAFAVNAVNLTLDPLLIFGLGPFKPLAAPGAAAATVAAEALGAALLLAQLRSTPLWPRSLGLPEWGEVREFAGASGAVLLRTAALQSTLLLATATVSRHAGDGAADIAGHQARGRASLRLSMRQLLAAGATTCSPRCQHTGHARLTVATLIFACSVPHETLHCIARLWCMLATVHARLQIALQTFFFLSYLMDALAVTGNGLVADGLGRGDVGRARAAAERCVAYGGVVAAVLAIVIGLAPGGVAAVFTDSRRASTSSTRTAMMMIAGL